MTISFAVKTVDEVRDDYLRVYANGLIRVGIPNPNVSSGTEIYCRGQAIAVQIGVAYAQLPAAADALMPDTAQGDDLIRQASPHIGQPRDAGGSTGPIVISVSIATPVLVPTGAQLTDTAGQAHKVAVGGYFSDGATITIEALSKGASTNLAAGSVLRWVTPPPFSANTATVGPGGLTGGMDAEDIEAYRQRFLDFLADPPGGGNAAQCNGWAESASVACQKAFTYPCHLGGATVQVCAVGAPTATNKTRQVASLTLSTVIEPFVASNIPEYAETTVTTPVDVPLDVVFGLSLPVSKQAGGPGGGWTDATPWPDTTFFGVVSSVTSSTVFTVPSAFAPTDGVTQIAWLSTIDWQVRTATVLSHTGSGPWTVTIDKPFVGIAHNDVISPNADRIATYYAAALAFFGAMGPGQVTTLAGLLPRALRIPSVDTSWPCDPTPAMCRAIENSGAEVATSTFLFRSATSCPTPSTPDAGPNIFVPRAIAFFPA